MNYMAQWLLISVSLLLVTHSASAQGDNLHSKQCATVHGRYAIYAGGDRLWIVGSKHLLEIVIDDLDKQ